MAANKYETCPGCGEMFSTTANGDKHRKILYRYMLVRTGGGSLLRIVEPNPVPPNCKVLSRGNQFRGCVDPASVGLVRNKGVWRMPASPEKFRDGKN